MVLFKRKPVAFPESPALPADIDTKVWYISHTKEWFLTYDEYLARMDYYNTKKFVCEITGNSCLTFFEAHDSEMREMKIVEDNFPEHLKEPILRHIQFSTVPRIDQLVDNVYSSFKNDYYPGETVMIRLNDYKNDFKTRCVIREKAKFNAIMDGATVMRPAYCQYRVSRVDNAVELTVDENQITRDRNNFTKWFVKTFIKLSVTRSPKLGAPWIVKQKYAERYRIPMELPIELAHFKEKPKPEKRIVSIRPKENTTKSKKTETGSRSANKKSSSSKAKVEAPKPQPPPKRTIQEDLELSWETTTERPVPHKLEGLGETVQQALEVWTFLNIYRDPLVLDTFTFDDFLTALKWDSPKKRCGLLDEIICAILSAFVSSDGSTINIPIPEDFDEHEEEQSAESHNSSTPKLGTNGNLANGDIKNEDTEEAEKEEDDEAEDEEISEIQEDTNRVDDYLTYRNTSWNERLLGRNFKDGNWQIILLGVLDTIRDTSSFKNVILEIFDVLAPLDSSVSPASLQDNFFHNLSLELRIKALSILCSLLVNTTRIRTHLDKSMEESTHLRRERSEKVRDYKAIYLKAQDIDKECRELIGKSGTPGVTVSNDVSTDQAPLGPSGKKRRRAGLTIEPTEEEIVAAKTNEAYAKLLASRTAQLKLAEGLRIERRTLEKKITELDVQRVKYIGKDRMFNRYWWFENNGLPNIGGKGSKRVDDEDEDEEIDEEEEDDGDEFAEETYLMGRLWVQGPSEDDLQYDLKIRSELIKEWKQMIEEEEEEEEEEGEQEEEEIKGQGKEKVAIDESQNEAETKSKDTEGESDNNKKDPSVKVKEEADSKDLKVCSSLPSKFVEGAEKLFDVRFDTLKSVITSADGGLLVHYGAFVQGIKPSQRKIIEEKPDPLLNSKDWRYYDKTEEIETLMKWLNQWGQRESKLLKELTNLKDQWVSSINSRRKALRIDNKSDEELELLNIIENTEITDSENEMSQSEDEADDSYTEDSDGISELEDTLSEQQETEVNDSRRTRRSIAEAEKQEKERRERELLLQKKLDERAAKRERSKPSLRIAKRELKKRKLREHEAKKELVETSREQLAQIQSGNELQRCLDWVNQSAIEKLGHFHYDGPKTRPKEKGRRGRR